MMFWYFKFGCNIVLRFCALRLYVDNFDTLTSTTTAWNVRITSMSEIALFYFDSTFINCSISTSVYNAFSIHYPFLLRFARDGDYKMLRTVDDPAGE